MARRVGARADSCGRSTCGICEAWRGARRGRRGAGAKGGQAREVAPLGLVVQELPARRDLVGWLSNDDRDLEMALELDVGGIARDLLAVDVDSYLRVRRAELTHALVVEADSPLREELPELRGLLVRDLR